MIKIEAAQRLLAALPLSLVRPVMKYFDRSRYATVFNKYGAGKGANKFRIYVPMTQSGLKVDKVTAPSDIAEAIAGKGYSIDDYSLGLAIDKSGKRTVKMGKLLSDKPALLQKFANDPSRGASKTANSIMVISRHPYDIMGMSFDRGWSSCMNAKEGSNKHYLPSDVSEGSLVAYMVKNTDKNINNPTARIAMRPYEGKTARILVAGPVYGTAPAHFEQMVTKFLQYLNAGAPSGVYKLVYGLYDDADEVVYHLKEGDTLPADCNHRKMLAAMATTSESHLMQLAKDMVTLVRSRVASNRSAPISVLSILAKDKNESVRDKVAPNPNIDDSIMSILSKDETPYIRSELADNPKTSPEVLAMLAKDTDMDVRRTVARNPKTSPANLNLLANDANRNVRINVVGSPSTSEATLLFLSKDEDPGVVKRVASRSTLVTILESLAKHKDYDVRQKVAANINTAIEILRLLATDKDNEVREEVAQNPNTPLEILEILAKDKDSYVLRNIADHPNISLELLTLLSRNKDDDVRNNVATNRKTPATILVALSKDKVDYVRVNVARNPNTPMSTLEFLTKDKSFRVSDSADYNIEVRNHD